MERNGIEGDADMSQGTLLLNADPFGGGNDADPFNGIGEGSTFMEKMG